MPGFLNDGMEEEDQQPGLQTVRISHPWGLFHVGIRGNIVYDL